MTRTKIFFDTEFTGLHKDTSLISIGLVSNCGKTFYAEFTDYKKGQINGWLQENVIKNLRLQDKITPSNSSWEHWLTENKHYTDALDFSLANKDMSRFECIGATKMIANRLEKWLSQFEQVEMWSDCLAYDWVLFCNIFGTAFDIPKNVYYIPFDICTMMHRVGVDPDENRENWLMPYAHDKLAKIMPEQKHNALWDALVIQACFEQLEMIEKGP